MTWKLKFRKQPHDFLRSRGIFEKVAMKIIAYVRGEKQDVKKLRGNWEDFLRLRVGKIRIIFQIDPDNLVIEVVKAGFRGTIYK